MKKLFFILIAGSLALAGCAKEENQPTTQKVTIGAVANDIVDADGVRSGYIDGLGMSWFDGEKVSMFRRMNMTTFEGGKPTEFTVVSDGNFPAKSATLTGEFPAAETRVPTHYVAVYPHDATAGYVTYMQDITISLPATQYYVNENGVSGVKGLPMIARGAVEDEALSFHPIYALLRIPVKLEAGESPVTIKSVKLTVNSGTENLAGRANLRSVDLIQPNSLGTFNITWAAGTKTITLDCGEGVEINDTEESVFFIGVPQPSGANLLGGYRLEFIGDEVTFAASTKTSAITIRTGTMYKLPILELSAPEVIVGAVEMPDAELRNYLVGIGAANDLGDGTIEITNPNLDVITLPTDVMSLKGLEAFSNLKTINVSMFGSSGNMVDIDLTPLKNLEIFRYKGSPTLTSVNASGLTKLYNLELPNNSKLETLNVSGCPKLIGVYVAATSGINLFTWIGSTGDGTPTGIRFGDGNFTRTYMPALKNLIAENMSFTTITSGINMDMNPSAANITIPNISVANCPNLTTMTLGGSYQTSPITMDISGTPLAADQSGITGGENVTFVF